MKENHEKSTEIPHEPNGKAAHISSPAAWASPSWRSTMARPLVRARSQPLIDVDGSFSTKTIAFKTHVQNPCSSMYKYVYVYLYCMCYIYIYIRMCIYLIYIYTYIYTYIYNYIYMSPLHGSPPPSPMQLRMGCHHPCGTTLRPRAERARSSSSSKRRTSSWTMGAEGFEWLKSDKFHPFIDGKCLKI